MFGLPHGTWRIGNMPVAIGNMKRRIGAMRELIGNRLQFNLV
ncbi:hypothetical protein [Sporosarcina aquimarina]|nr:hypothetical protein [Sporosarcina aquimarina]